jgi:hypothetical protein
MGTDIHMAVERRNRAGRWQYVPDAPPEARDEYWSNKAKENPTDKWAQEFCKRWYTDRNYEAFAILANVRNGSGFAGCDTGDGFRYIAAPRGLPSDLSDALRTPINRTAMEESGLDVSDIREETEKDVDSDDDGFWLGDHSFTYFTVDELLAFDWEGQTTKLRGIIPLEEWIERERTGNTKSPASYCGGIAGQGIVTFTQQGARAMVQACGAVVAPPGARVHVRAEWEETYAEAAGGFYSRVLPALAKLDKNPANVRVVMGFDS